MRITSSFRLIIGFGALLIVSTAVSALSLYYPARRWFPADVPREIRVDERGHPTVNEPDHGVSRALEAVAAWNGGGAGTLLTSRSAQVAYLPQDGISDVIFDDPLGLCVDECVAIARVSYNDPDQKGCCDGLTVFRHLDGDIAFNPDYDLTTLTEIDGCSQEHYLEAVLKHEVGHLLGLDHPGVFCPEVMCNFGSCVNREPTVKDLANRDALFACSSFAEGACLPDTDADLWDDAHDNCPAVANFDQKDSDLDTVGNVCDNCPSRSNMDQSDIDGDGLGDPCDVCPAFFRNFPAVRIVSPNGGEQLSAGVPASIQWLTCLLPLGDTWFDLYLSRDAGSTFESIATDVEGSAFNWIVAGAATPSALMKIVARDPGDGITREDRSDSVFTILNPCNPDAVSPQAQVVWPNGGATMRIGTTVTLEWTASDACAVSSVDLLLSRNGAGGSYQSLFTGIPNTGTKNWTVTGPATPGSTAFLKVIARDPSANAGSDVSDSGSSIACFGPCQISYCGDEGIRCTHNGTCGAGGCCNYTCASDPSCLGADEVPASACGGH